MKKALKDLLVSLGWRISRAPRGTVVGQDLWHDLGLLLGPSPLCFDVGANHGDVSDELLRLRPAAMIHAFEPGAACQEKLKTRFGSEARVTLVPSGLGDQAGESEFRNYANDQLSSFLSLQTGENNPFRAEPEMAKGRAVITTIDHYCTEHGISSIDFLKVDTQGFDLRVLKGGEKLFGTGGVRYVLIELNFISLYQGQAWGYEIMAWLHQHGLQLVDFYEKCRQDQRMAWCTALFAKT